MKKVMLDECITQQCARAVVACLKLEHSIIDAYFLCDYLNKSGEKDCDWADMLIPPSDWIVISSDCGTHGPRVYAKGPPLPEILPKKGITGFFLAGKTLTQAKGAERARAIISKMPQILSLADTAEPGQRFKITMSGNGIVVARWDRRPSRPT